MRKTNFFSMTALICLLTLGVSCSKDDTGVPPNDDSENPSDETGFTLTIPAMPAFSDNWYGTNQENDERPYVGWEKFDRIFIGSIDETIEDNTSLQTLIEKGKFTGFICNSVNDDGTATFVGENIPENANIAVYAGQPESVFKVTKTIGEANHLAFAASCNGVSPNTKSPYEHLKKNDFLVAGFDYEKKSIVFGKENYEGKAFGRAYALSKFVLTLPDGVSGTLGKFESIIINEDEHPVKLSSWGLIMPYNLNSETGIAETQYMTGDFVVDCSNLSMDGNRVTFYSLIGPQNISGKKLNFSLRVGNNIYISNELQIPIDIVPDMAISLDVEFLRESEAQEENVGGNSNVQDFEDWVQWGM